MTSGISRRKINVICLHTGTQAPSLSLRIRSRGPPKRHTKVMAVRGQDGEGSGAHGILDKPPLLAEPQFSHLRTRGWYCQLWQSLLEVTSM